MKFRDGCRQIKKGFTLFNAADIRDMQVGTDSLSIYAAESIQGDFKRGESMEQEEKINKLEIEIAHLEEYARKLNDAAIEQGETIVQMQKQIRELYDKISNDAEEIDESKKPPHY